VGVESSSKLVHMRAVTPDHLMKLVAGHRELFGPVSDIRRYFGIDLFGVVRTFHSVILMQGVGLMAFGSVVVLRHECFLFSGSLG
jgi:hypothetical protein